MQHENESSQRTPAKTSGEPKPAPARRAGRGAPAGKPSVDGGPVMAQATGTQALVASMPHNANKALDFGRDNALDPPVGLTAEPASDAVSASTLSEVNVSAKTGDPASPGGHAIDGRLAQARVDGSKQVLTTNQGVAIADNQNSLKAGLRGPTLLEDFILREKITHFDHERIPERRQQAAARIKRASRDMNRLITDLLEYTRTRLGAGIPIDRSACDLGPVCEASLEDTRAGNPEQQFVQRMSGDLNLQADAARMQQALSNLLSNAVQHGSRQSPVTLTADGAVDAIVLKVSNSGDPIPPDALQAIFEPLVQAPNASSEVQERSKTSLGLGLFIVREIVLAHGGTISVESSAAAGTVFTIRLPRPPV